MLKIRLTRMGAKKNPFYRIIVIDSKAARNGAPTDTIGWYDPAKLDAPVKIDEEKVLSWLGKRRTADRHCSFHSEKERHPR